MTRRQALFFFFNDTATTEIYTLSLHDALPILALGPTENGPGGVLDETADAGDRVWINDYERTKTLSDRLADRKSTRLNSSHANISYAVFCLKKKNPHSSTPLKISTSSCVI